MKDADELWEWGKKNGFLVEMEPGKAKLSDGIWAALKRNVGPSGHTLLLGNLNVNILNAALDFRPKLTVEEQVKAHNLLRGFLRMMETKKK